MLRQANASTNVMHYELRGASIPSANENQKNGFLHQQPPYFWTLSNNSGGWEAGNSHRYANHERFATIHRLQTTLVFISNRQAVKPRYFVPMEALIRLDPLPRNQHAAIPSMFCLSPATCRPRWMRPKSVRIATGLNQDVTDLAVSPIW